MKRMHIECHDTQYPVLRQYGDDYQTIALELRNASTKRIARVIGVGHLGHPEYYAAIAELFQQRPHSKILVEAVNIPKDAGNDEIAKEIRRHASSTARLKKMIVEATSGVIICDEDGLQIPPERKIKSDITFRKLVNIVREENSDEFSSDETSMLNFLERGMKIPFLKHFFRAWIKSMFYRSTVDDVKEEKLAAPSKVKVDIRNNHLLGIAHQVSQDGDIEIPWGAYHVPGIVAELVDTGEWQIDPESIRYLTFLSSYRLFKFRPYGTGKLFIPKL